MVNKKLEGIIEAVHFSLQGRIIFVRLYERHGTVWSDRVLLDRRVLAERLEHGKHFATGSRKQSLGGVFETRSTVRLQAGDILTDGQAGGRDSLPGVPVL
jgi:hypothetical protein